MRSLPANEVPKNLKGFIAVYCIQYDGSKDDLDWRIDFRYLNFI